MTKMFCSFKGQSFSTPSSSVPEPTLAITRVPANVGGESSTHTATISPFVPSPEPSRTEGEQADMSTEPTKLPTITPPKTKIIGSLSRPQLTDPIVEVQVSQPTDDPPHTTPKDNKGKGIARDTNESPYKLVPASKEVCSDPNTLVLIPYEINGKMYQLTNEQIHAHIEKEERMQKVAQEAKLIELSKPELIKVAEEVASKAKVDPNALRSKKGGKVGINQTLPPIEQTSSLSSRRKKKSLELDLEVRIASLECNRSLPEGIPLVNKKVIETPEHVIFFIDAFKEQAFQR
ncbi:hypothetical protein Tco_1449368 [Tanacetum coccineum]